MHAFSEQYDGSDSPLKFIQWSNQLPHLQLLSLVPLMLFTFIVPTSMDHYGLDSHARVRYVIFTLS